MKKILLIVYSIISIISFLILFNLYDIIEFDKLKNIETRDTSYTLRIDKSIDNIPSDEVYDKLTSILDKFNANITYTTSYLIENESILIKYVYPKNSYFLNDLNLLTKESLNESKLREKFFLSSFKSNIKEQSGLIYDFRNNNKIVITSLENAINKKSLSGDCVVNLDNPDNLNNFINQLSKDLNISIDSIVKDTYSPYWYIYIYLFILVLYIILSLIVLYIIINSYKDIAIKKMLGYNTKDIWIDDMKKLLLSQFLINILINLFMFIFFVTEYNYFILKFILILSINIIINLLLTFFFLSIPYLYINKISLSSMIKDKKDVHLIIRLNTIIKVLIIIIFIVCTSLFINEYSSINSFYKTSYAKWEETKNYKFIGGIKCDSYEEFISEDFNLKLKNLYMFFNEKGSILADFCEFEEDFIKLNKNADVPVPLKSLATVNPNYLLKNIIYDYNNDIINISENELDTIIIVPEKYKNFEKEIVEYFSYLENNVEIIYSKDNQSLFSYNILVKSQNGNYVTDPVIKVVTENNSNLSEYSKVAAYTSNPFKINTADIDFNNVLKYKANELDIYENLVNIYSAYDDVAYSIYALEKKFSVIIFIVSICISIIMFMIFQNTLNYFIQNKKIIAVKSFHGYNHYDKYKEYYIYLLYSWIFISISLLFLSLFGFNINWLVYLFSVIAELIVSLLHLKKVEKLKVVKVIKRG